ncbi:hypothetical protein GCM10009853_064770 [Glycomyces scopariae]|uniref:Septum formation n=2 Tax=Glycomyces sambucus TaxID=380244 RepID=A0A1G9HBU9_9ACTN|nr:hypothetical protein SAMN05216298_2757 [Glycomyces sambucus]
MLTKGYSVGCMTVPPNYGPQPGPPPEQPQTPGYGFQSPYNGGQSPYGSQPQQPQPSPYGSAPQYSAGQAGGGQPPYGAEPPPYGGPVLPPEPPKRNYGLIGGVIVGVLVLVLGGVLLVVLNMNKDDGKDTAADPTTGEEASPSEEASASEEATEEEQAGSEVGQCLPYEPVIADGGYGDGLELVDCADATAFWEITAQSYDVTDVAVDEEGNLTDFTAAKALCGDDWAVLRPGEAWSNWHYVYSSGTLDSLYCIKATGAADPSEPANTPYVPAEGDCFYDAESWWTVDCGSDLAQYVVVGVVNLDTPVAMTEDEAADQATCGGSWYWQVTDPEGRTSAILCGDDV